jgi:hypothetical protein
MAVSPVKYGKKKEVIFLRAEITTGYTIGSYLGNTKIG